MIRHICDTVEPEDIPDWILNYTPGAKVSRKEILRQSRAFFYPGAAFDAMPIELMSKTKCWHWLIYVDDLVYKDRNSLINGTGFTLPIKGYKILGSFDFDAYSVMFVLEREPISPEWLAEEFGPKRFAILFVDDDATRTFRRLLSYDEDWAPHTMLLSFDMMIQNKDFGGGSAFEKEVMVAPPFFLIYDDERGRPWSHYKDVGAHPMYGGMNDTRRVLYQHKFD